MKKIILFVLLIIFSVGGVAGCMTKDDDKRPDTVNREEEILTNLQEKYDSEFEVIGVEEEGVTVAGRSVPNSYFLKSKKDGTMFRYIEHSDGEVDDYYLPMKQGNDYYQKELKGIADEIYGEGNYTGQAILFPDSELDGNENDGKTNMRIKLFLSVKTFGELDRDLEAEKAANLFNRIHDVSSKNLQIGYFFDQIPGNIDSFLSYETTGVNDTFSSFYGDQMSGQLILFSTIHGMDVEQSDIKNLFKTDLEGE